MKLLIKWLLSALALLCVAYLYSGVAVASFGSAMWAALVIGLLNALVRLNHDLGLTVILAEHRLERVLPYVDSKAGLITNAAKDARTLEQAHRQLAGNSGK